MTSQRSSLKTARRLAFALLGASGLAPAAWAAEEPGENTVIKGVRIEGQVARRPDSSPASSGDGTPEGRFSDRIASVRDEAIQAEKNAGDIEIDSARTVLRLAEPIQDQFKLGKVTVSSSKSRSEQVPAYTIAQGGVKTERPQLGVITIDPAPGQDAVSRISYVISLNNELGLNLTAPDAAIRLHLELPEGQGLVVSGISPESPAAKTGLRVNDIILNLDSEPLKDQGELISKLKARAEKPAELKVLRGGKPITIKVRPRLKVQIDPVEDVSTAFWIGVSVSEVDDLIKSQLSLPQGQGLIVNDVAKDSPGEKAGVKVNDILTEMAGKPLRDPQAMRNAVQSAGKNPVEVMLFRTGKPQTVTIEPVPHLLMTIQSDQTAVRSSTAARSARRPGESIPAAVPFRQLQLEQGRAFEGAGQTFRLFGNPANGQFARDPAAVVGQAFTNLTFADTARREDQGKLDQRLDDLSREIKELREAIRELAKSEKK
ncbi:PDZ domain-containing protein [Isosphaeraceae bacterium EP7]